MFIRYKIIQFVTTIQSNFTDIGQMKSDVIKMSSQDHFSFGTNNKQIAAVRIDNTEMAVNKKNSSDSSGTSTNQRDIKSASIARQTSNFNGTLTTVINVNEHPETGYTIDRKHNILKSITVVNVLLFYFYSCCICP